MAAADDDDVWAFLKSQGLMTGEEIAAAKQAGEDPTALASAALGDVTAGGSGVVEQPGSGEDIFAERPFEHGGDRAQTYDAEGKIGDPPGRGPGLPPGYKRNLELIDWLQTQTPSAEDLQYEAPTYSEESLGLPSSSQAGQAIADPSARAAQREALTQMRDELGNRGMGPEDILALTRISKQAEDVRLAGEQSRMRGLQARGGVAGGAQLAGAIGQGNQLRGAVQEARAGVLGEHAGRGQQAAQRLGAAGVRFGQQVFGEQFERGAAQDVLSRANAMALTRRGEDVRGMSNRAEKQRAQSGLQASAMRHAPASAYLNFYQNEAGVRGREAATAAAVEAENKRREAAGPDAWDWIKGAGTLALGIGTGNPALIASGGAQTIGNIEGATNKPEKVKKPKEYQYG